MSRFFDYLRDAVRSPREQLTRGQHQVRFAWELAIYCGRQLIRHRAEGMAAELTYRTIFALIPVVVLGLVMFRVFGGLEDVQSKVEDQLYSFFGVPEVSYEQRTLTQVDDGPTGEAADDDLVPRDDDTGDESETGDAENGQSLSGKLAAEIDREDASGRGDDLQESEVEALAQEIVRSESDEAQDLEAELRTRASIRKTLHELTGKIATLDFASIGVIGLLLFIYAAVALADSTEYLFNRIYDAPSQRPLHIRVAIHWSIITLGSGLLALSLYMSSQVIDWFGAIDVIGGGQRNPVILTLNHLLSVLASWVMLFLLYALMPNTHVSVRAAAAGSAVSALLWEAAKYGFQIYVAKAVPYSALYGALGLIPLFLFWIYVTWLIVLFGLILTYTLQTLNGRRSVPGDSDADDLPGGDPDWMLPIMTEVATAFEDGGVIGRQELADRLGLSSRVVREMETSLIGSGLLRRVAGGAGEEESLTLAKPSSKIFVSRILELAHQHRPTSEHRAWKTLASLKQAEREAAGDKTLADLLPFSPAS